MNEDIKKGREVFRDLKDKLEKDIDLLILKFEEETGATVESITVPTYTMAGRSDLRVKT